jgi:hypothetical protein
MKKIRGQNHQEAAWFTEAFRDAQQTVDLIGRLDVKMDELEHERNHHAEELKQALAKFKSLGLEPKVEGMHYQGNLYDQEKTSIPVIEFKRVCPPSKFLSCVQVIITRAREVLGSETVAEQWPPTPGTPRLVVKAKAESKQQAREKAA